MSAVTTSPLDAAREHVRQAAIAADNAGDWRSYRLLSPLHDAADMVCRVGDHDHSRHYQADKGGDLVLAALRVRRGAFELYGGFLRDEGPLTSPIEELTELLVEVERGAESVMWATSREWSVELPSSTVGALRDRIRKLAAWVDALPTIDSEDGE